MMVIPEPVEFCAKLRIIIIIIIITPQGLPTGEYGCGNSEVPSCVSLCFFLSWVKYRSFIFLIYWSLPLLTSTSYFCISSPIRTFPGSSPELSGRSNGVYRVMPCFFKTVVVLHHLFTYFFTSFLYGLP